MLRRPRRVTYAQRLLRVASWVEWSFGQLVDSFGPVLLRRRLATSQVHLRD